MTRTPDNDLKQELARSRSIRIRPGLVRSEDPREFGRRVARENFERYLQTRELASDTEER